MCTCSYDSTVCCIEADKADVIGDIHEVKGHQLSL